MDKQTVVHPRIGILLSKKWNRLQVHATVCINLKCVVLSERSQIQNYASIYMIFWKRKNYGNRKQINSSWGFGKEKLTAKRMGEFLEVITLLYILVVVKSQNLSLKRVIIVKYKLHLNLKTKRSNSSRELEWASVHIHTHSKNSSDLFVVPLVSLWNASQQCCWILGRIVVDCLGL